MARAHLVELNAWNHARLRNQVNHLVAVRVALEESLPVQDDTRDVFRESRRLVLGT